MKFFARHILDTYVATEIDGKNMFWSDCAIRALPCVVKEKESRQRNISAWVFQSQKKKVCGTVIPICYESPTNYSPCLTEEGKS